MTRIMTLATVFTVLLMLVAAPAVAQDRAPVSVKRTVVVTGVVLVDILRANGKKAQLQCNQESHTCKELKSGNYLMAELPENTGKYDCKNAEIYAEDKLNDEQAEPLGEYCLIEK